MDSFEIPFYNYSLKVSGSDQGVTEIRFQKSQARKSLKPSLFEKQFLKDLDDYLSAKTSSLNVEIDWKNLTGTDFQKQVWRQMKKIKSGKTQSYGEVAKAIRRPGAVRAVGTACGKNPVMLAVPCHRVVGANGLGGFSGGGLPIKKKLLSLEGHSLQL